MPAKTEGDARVEGAATVGAVERGTRPRGKPDTAKKKESSRIRSAAPRAFRIAIVVAILLHAPLIPTRLFGWLSILLGAQTEDVEELDGEALIPIDLDLEPGQTAAPVTPPPPETKEPEQAPESEPAPSATAKPIKKPEGPKDAGPDADKPDAATPDAAIEDAGIADAAGDAATSLDGGDAGDGGDGGDAQDAGTSDAAAPIASLQDGGASDGGAVAKAPEDAGADAEGPARVAELDDAGADAAPPTPMVKDPLATAGAPGDFVGKNPNVSVLIAGDKIRKHELGMWFGRILVTIPQWRGFFKDTPLDPIRDLDHIVLAGPQMRDSRKVVAVMDFNVPEKKMRDSIDIIIKRSTPPGKWLEGTPVPAAQAKADNGDRVFALAPGKHLLIVIPADVAKTELPKVKSLKAFSKSSAAGIVISMVTPHRAFKGLPIAIPDTLKSMRVSVIPTEDGGANILLEAVDANPDLAKEHAEKLSSQIETMRQIDIPLIGKFEIIGPAAFTTERELIRATSHVTNKQLRLIMSRAEQEMLKQVKAAEAKPTSSTKK